MPYPTFHYLWQWDFASSPEVLWPLFANTNRFDRDTGLGGLAPLTPAERSLGHGRIRQVLTQFGLPLAYEQEPFEWDYPRRFGVYRRFSSGPVASLRVRTSFTRLENGGTRFAYETWAVPANPLGLLAIPVQIGVISAASFARVFHTYDRLAQQQKGLLEAPGQARFAAGGLERLESTRRPLQEAGFDVQIVGRLLDLIRTADDLALGRIRPYALADYWGARRKTLPELCLQSTRLGLLDLQWEVLCPQCRGASQAAAGLNQVEAQQHCGSCKLDYQANFDRQVELTFRPNPSIRRLGLRDYCLGGPETSPHILAQKLAPAGQAIELSPLLQAGGRYLLRSFENDFTVHLIADPALPPEQICEVDWQSQPAPLAIATRPRLLCRNPNPEERLFILEQSDWSDQAVLAAEVTALQIFRDLFSSESLRPDVQMFVGSLALLFTDLRNSTRMYREIGDAPAFGRVLNHFDVVRAAVAAQDGAIVKTMGDGVMAAFRHPAAALSAAYQAQRALASAGPAQQALKVGLHFGPCIAVTLNERLDYFGSTVNIAARLSDLSNGADLIVSQAVLQDPEVQTWLAAAGLRPQAFSQVLRGFDQPSELGRISSE